MTLITDYDILDCSDTCGYFERNTKNLSVSQYLFRYDFLIGEILCCEQNEYNRNKIKILTNSIDLIESNQYDTCSFIYYGPRSITPYKNIKTIIDNLDVIDMNDIDIIIFRVTQNELKTFPKSLYNYKKFIYLIIYNKFEIESEEMFLMNCITSRLNRSPYIVRCKKIYYIDLHKERRTYIKDFDFDYKTCFSLFSINRQIKA